MGLYRTFGACVSHFARCPRAWQWAPRSSGSRTAHRGTPSNSPLPTWQISQRPRKVPSVKQVRSSTGRPVRISQGRLPPQDLTCELGPPPAEVPLSEGPLLKRKKTVTWADGELELEPELSPLSRLPSSGAAADLAAGGSSSSGSGSGSGGAPCTTSGGGGAGQRQDGPVVVLPCDGLFDSLSLELLEQQGVFGGGRQQPVLCRLVPCCPVLCRVAPRWLALAQLRPARPAAGHVSV